MSHDICQQDPSALLSTHLWTQIFSQLLSPTICAVWIDQHDKQRFGPQEDLLNLRRVCYVFKAVCDSEPRFRRRLVLSSSFSNASLPSLTAWLQKHTGTIQAVTVLADFGSPLLDEVLQRFVNHSTALTAVSLRACSESILQLLPTFQSLARVQLDFGLSETLTLNPLLGLPALEALQLRGGFSVCTMDELPPQLTGLSLLCCEMHTGPSIRCLSSLQTVRVSCSLLSGFHPDGLLAFHALHELVCIRGCIMASTIRNTLDASGRGNCVMPFTLSTLTALTKLRLRAAAGTSLPGTELDLSCLYSLEALQHLQLSAAGTMCITAGLSGLAMLTRLELEVDSIPDKHNSWFETRKTEHLRLGVEWADMPALPHVAIDSQTVCYDESLLALARMQHLTCLEFFNFTPPDFASSQIFAELVYLLAKNRPQVVVCMADKQLGNDHHP
ncbi:hypothetical protein ABBQ38_003068 [Trebouxia sp. C0009 RCD-2024]